MSVGIDIGSSSIKIVSAQTVKGVARLLSAGAVKTPGSGIVSESEQELVGVAQAIKKLISDNKIVSREVVAGVAESDVVTKMVSMPNMSDQELAAAIEWEVEQYIPMQISEANISYEVISRPKDATAVMKVLIVAVSKKVIDKYIQVLSMAGLKVVGVENSLLAAARSLAGENSTTTMVVDLGARSTSMAVVSAGKVVFTRSIATGGEAFSRSIAVGLSMDLSQSEEYKKTYGMDPGKLEGKLRAVLIPVYDVVLAEIRKAVEYYKSQEPTDQLRAVSLCGGGAGLPGLSVDMAAKLGIEVVIGDPFVKLAKDEKMTAALAGYGPLYAAAVGLSLKDV